MFAPLGNKILVELDHEVRMWKSIHLPDEDFIDRCSRCDRMMEALDGPCHPTLDFGWDDYHERPYSEPIGMDTSHKIERVTAPVVLSPSRIGTVLMLGPACNVLSVGDRIIVGSTAGGSLEDLRLVSEDVVYAVVT